MPTIQTPTLIVELGSTPQFSEKELCTYLLSLSDADRERVAFVHIDTAEESGDLKKFHTEHAGRFQRFWQKIVVPLNINYAALPQKYEHTFIFPFQPQPYASGAGEVRNNGHVAMAFDYSKAKQALENGFRALENLRNRQGVRAINAMQICIVAFLGGGTGSGIIGDVTVEVRQMLRDRKYEQHIILFCVLPDEVEGVDDYSMDRRKSNATASLLEMVALSLVGNAQANGVYQKYLLDNVQQVQSGPIANEIYLYGRTRTGSVEGTMSVVALDLFQRITDGGGVGEMERNAWMARSALGGRDDRGLPTMFGTSSPHAVIFPAAEVARAYARLTARQILPRLVIRPPQPEISVRDQTAWGVEWREVAAPEVSGLVNPYAVPPPREFSAGEFDGIEPSDLDAIWTELEERQRESGQQIKAALDRKEADERQQIKTVPPAPPGEYISPMFRKVIHLSRLQAEYEQAKRDEEKQHVAEPLNRRPRWRNYPWYAVPGIGKLLKAGAREALRRQHNQILNERATWDRHRLLLTSLEGLLADTKTRLSDALNWFMLTGASLESQRTALELAARSSEAWHGRLESRHPHLRHLYHLKSLYADPNDENSPNRATERLYLKTTCPDLDEDAIERALRSQGSGALDRLVEERIARFIDGCTRYLTTGRYGGVAGQHMEAEFERHSSDSLVDSVVGFFYEYYMDKFSRMNLFDLLWAGGGQGPDSSVERCLYEHLNHIEGLIRPMIDFDMSLSKAGRKGLPTNFYLGMYWRNQGQEAILRRAVSKVSVLNDQNQTPLLSLHDDPHWLQVMYGQHGISLSMMSQFYPGSDSMMAHYTANQSAWFGADFRAQMAPDPQTYGNEQPVHNSSEMERLVCDPVAFGYSASQPHTQRYSTNLVGRVIREATTRPGVPTWNGNAAAAAGGGASPSAPGGWPVITSSPSSAPTGTPPNPPATPPPGNPAPFNPPASNPWPAPHAPSNLPPGSPGPASNPPAANPITAPSPPGTPPVSNPNPAPSNPAPASNAPRNQRWGRQTPPPPSKPWRPQSH